VALVLSSLVVPSLFLANGLVMLVLFYWSQRDPDYEVRLLLWRLRARYTPLVYVLLRLVAGSFPVQQLVAAVVANAYMAAQDSALVPVLRQSTKRAPSLASPLPSSVTR